MLSLNDLNLTLDALGRVQNGYPWRNIRASFPAYVPDYGFINILHEETDPDWDSVETTYTFNFSGVPEQTFQIVCQWDSWEATTFSDVYEVEEYTEPVTKYRRKQ